MMNYNRDLLILYKADVYSEDILQKQVECLHQILERVESNDEFCKAHELATRTHITKKSKHIIRAIERPELKPFHFLINVN
jgi:hypothetical protein